MGNQRGDTEDPRRLMVGMKLGCTISCSGFGRGIAETEQEKICFQLILNLENCLDNLVKFSWKHFFRSGLPVLSSYG